MRWLLWTLLLFGLAVGIALIARFSNGNISIFWPPYRVDLSVNLALALVLGSFVLLHLTLLGARKMGSMTGEVKEYREARALEKAHGALSEALMAGFEGRFGKVERLAREAQTHPQTNTLASLLGARAAHRMREYTRRDEWLAQVNDPKAQNAKWVTQAELLVEEQKPEQALAAIDQAQRLGARHIHVMRTALRAHEQNSDWSEVIRLTRALDKRGLLHDAASAGHRINAYRRLSQTADGSGLSKLWIEVRAQSDIRPRLAGYFAERFEAVGNVAAARQIYKDEIDDSFNAAFVRRFLALEGQALTEKLSIVEHWQKRYGNEPDLLLALGELCRREQLWGKAQTLLEKTIGIKPTPAAYYALAQLFENLDKTDQANAQYKEAARLHAAAANYAKPDASI
jgi:HemY protein